MSFYFHFYSLHLLQNGDWYVKPDDDFLSFSQASHFYYKLANCSRIPEIEKELEKLIPGTDWLHKLRHLLPVKNGSVINSIVGFHKTSLKFKLQNYRSFWDFTFMMYESSWKLIFIQIFVSKGVSIKRGGRVGVGALVGVYYIFF